MTKCYWLFYRGATDRITLAESITPVKPASMLIEKPALFGKADSNPVRILESIPDGFICVDSHWIIQYCNRNSEKILGIPRETMIGLNLWECFPRCENLKFFSQLHEAMTVQQPVFFEEYYKPLQLWVEVSAHFAEGSLSIYFKDVGLQKEQERKLKEMNERYNHVMRFVSEAIWEWEIGAATATWHGDSLTKLLGYKPEEEKTVACWEKSVHPDDLPKVKHTFQTTLVNGESFYTNQYRLRKKSGEYIYVRDRVSIIRDTNGTPVKVVGVTDDVTVQKQYETALIEAKESYQSLFYNAPLPKWVYDKQTLCFLDVNAAAVRHYGYSREEFLEMTLLDICPKEEHLKVIDNIRNNGPFGGVWTHIKKNDEQILAEVSVTSLVYQSKNVYLTSINDITEKNKTELALQKSQQKLTNILESIGDGLLVVDRNWTISYLNAKAEKLLGNNKAHYLDRHLWEVFNEVEAPYSSYEYHRAMQENVSIYFEEYYPPLAAWFQVSAYPSSEGLSIYFRNVTEKKNDEKKLEFIARATSEVIWEREINAEEAFINVEKFHAVFGYRLPGNNVHYSFWLERVHPEDVGSITYNNQLAIENDIDYHMHEYRFKKADGSWAYVKDRVYVVRDEANKPVRMIGAMEDITAERLAEKALQESEQAYKQLFDYAALPKAVYDRETLQILNVNQAAIDHYGYSRGEFLNMTILDVRPSEDHAKVKEMLAKLSPNNRINIGVWTHIKKGGERIHVEISMASINYKGRLCNLVSAQDVTEERRLQEQLVKEKIEKQRSITKATLKVQEKERSEIGRELHDGVNQMLTTAKLYVENINYFPEQKEAFIDKSVCLLQKSINEIRVLSKALVTPVITDIGFKEALFEMINCYKDLNLFDVEYCIQPEVEKIEKEIKLTVYRIIQEQLTNIVKYAKASLIKVQILLKNQEVWVLIEDNGVGFDLTQKKTGIGLSNMKNRAELFKGKVKIKSTPGKGCKIEIAFPV